MKDYSGLKYQVAEELGEDIDIVIFKFDKGSESFNFFKRKHSQFDGLSAMADVLKQQGAIVKKLPMQSIGKEPGTWKSIKLMKQFLSTNGKATAKWKDQVDFEIVGKSKGFIFTFFSKEQTKKILEHKRTSLSSFLIHSLDEVSLDFFIDREGMRKWILPLNMRQRNKHEQYYGNCTASFVLHTGEGRTESDIQNELLEAIKRDDHWGSWFYTNMPKYLGKTLLKRIASKLRNNGHGYLTHMGKWPTKNIVLKEENEQELWMTASIPSRVVPLAAACILWNDQLALTLRTHPCLKQELGETGELMKAWLDKIALVTNLQNIPKVYSVKEGDIK
jgi:hypothetical protein